MPTTQHHRGAHPEDARLFAPAQVARLRVAAEEIAWLLERGYPMKTAITVVGGHHQLEARQRLALQRATSSPTDCRARHARALAPAEVRGRALHVDALNLVITLEVALGRGTLIEGCDGALRDLAGLRGSYHVVDETEPALALIGDALAELGAARASFLFDAPVSNSGRLRALLLERAQRWSTPVDATLVPSPDAALAGVDGVVSADAIVLDRAATWANVAAWVVRARVPDATIVNLAPPSTPP